MRTYLKRDFLLEARPALVPRSDDGGHAVLVQRVLVVQIHHSLPWMKEAERW